MWPPNLTMMVTGHGNIKSYLYKYKTIDSSIFPWKIGEQTTDHILYDCELVKQERDKLKAEITVRKLERKQRYYY